MPLSEHEQKLLDQMEQALYAEDPRFASHMKGGAGRRASRNRIALGCCAAVLGLAVLMAGVAFKLVPLGVVGFVVMVAGVAWAVTPARTVHLGSVGGPTTRTTTGARRAGTRRRGGSSGSLTQRMEERWEKRRREGQGW